MNSLPLVTVHDREWDGASLILTVFGPDFAVRDGEGRWLTSPRNASLLRQAKSMIGRRAEATPDALLSGLRLLAGQADPAPVVGLPADWRQCLQVIDPFDHSRFAGSLD
ncbi:MAG: hypothetical protein JNM82_12140 [Rhodocyclaceae bacterium]|nr:hypothetical protein [Rhodocyclaceae bacterium]